MFENQKQLNINELFQRDREEQKDISFQELEELSKRGIENFIKSQELKCKH